MSILPLHDSVLAALTNPQLDIELQQELQQGLEPERGPGGDFSRPESVCSAVLTPTPQQVPQQHLPALQGTQPGAGTQQQLTSTPVSVLSSSSQDSFSILGDSQHAGWQYDGYDDDDDELPNRSSFIMPRLTYLDPLRTADADDKTLQVAIIGVNQYCQALRAKLAQYRALSHCQFGLDLANDTDIAITVGKNVFTSDHVKTIPLKLDQSEEGIIMDCAICRPIAYPHSSDSDNTTMMVLIDFLSNCQDISYLNGVKTNTSHPMSLNDINSLLIKSISIEVESKLLSLTNSAFSHSSVNSTGKKDDDANSRWLFYRVIFCFTAAAACAVTYLLNRKRWLILFK